MSKNRTTDREIDPRFEARMTDDEYLDGRLVAYGWALASTCPVCAMHGIETATTGDSTSTRWIEDWDGESGVICADCHAQLPVDDIGATGGYVRAGDGVTRAGGSEG